MILRFFHILGFALFWLGIATIGVSSGLDIYSPPERQKAWDSEVEISGYSQKEVSVYLNGSYLETFPPGHFNKVVDLFEVGKNVLNFVSQDDKGKLINVIRRVSVKAERS